MINRSGIYQILNTVNGKRYIGSAVCFKTRWNNHKNSLVRGIHQPHLQNAWNKYGADKFEFEILLLCSKENLLFYEQLLLDAFKGNLYNISPTAGNVLGMKHTEEARRKMSLNNAMQYQEYRDKVSRALTGRKANPEAVKKTADSNRGKKRSPEFKALISEYNRNRPQEMKDKLRTSRLGVPHTESAKEKLRAANLGRPVSEETRAKISKAGKGKTISQEHKDKISAFNKGKVVSQETREKLRIAAMGQTAWNKGVSHTEETKAKMKANHWRNRGKPSE